MAIPPPLPVEGADSAEHFLPADVTHVRELGYKFRRGGPASGHSPAIYFSSSSGKKMKGASHGGAAVRFLTYTPEDLPRNPARDVLSSRIVSRSYGSRNKVNTVVGWMNRLSTKADSYAKGIREHVKLGPKISDTLKGKLSLGARILQAGGVEKAFRQFFGARESEQLLKASHCYLSTTAGPIAGMLFISTEKIAFHSDRSLSLSSSSGEAIRTPYKVIIPLRKIKRASPAENASKPSQKYIQITTVDEFEFWFMGFVSYSRSFKYVQRACSSGAS